MTDSPDDIRITEHIGKMLRRRRKLLQLTQMELGKRLSLGFQQIQKYECGANRMRAALLYRFAVELGVPIDYFYPSLLSAPTLAQQQTKEPADGQAL